MRRRNNIFILSILAVFLFAGIFFIKESDNFLQNIKPLGRVALIGQKEPPIVIAACPTFYYMLEKLENNKNIKTIKTRTTAESLRLLEQGRANLAISGRALKADEPEFLFKKIGPGYDFVFREETLILENKMDLVPFYTNLPIDKIIKDFQFISENNLIKIENIYEYLDKGVIITFLENKIEGEPVHILKEDGSRVRLSKLPRLYYSSDLTEENINFIEEIIKETASELEYRDL